MDGLLLFAHGARDPSWAQPFQRIAERIAVSRPGVPLALAYLELMQPGIAEAAETLIAQGCRHVHIVPMFLGASGHVRRDVPPLIEQLRLRHGESIVWTLHPAIGEQDSVVAAMAAASLQALERTEQR
ncbi:CbiX/SirB N-terminal domain-containing protein [Paucibacter sp. APW11]|uniref:CbiX/SirB N-terminal domain-containing protein n=1 Tax=Roseateles aquae TaxID=3077235 RepID=A0ABU3P5W2_9BURK|nr:CbiX/SirB N-terminal domain-containing protein [Paucibacter sp. APW11]MDT8997970.1 CbiX/SirB N-terminal domain-containing protein [Paucibacter sp. APW11]